MNLAETIYQKSLDLPEIMSGVIAVIKTRKTGRLTVVNSSKEGVEKVGRLL